METPMQFVSRVEQEVTQWVNHYIKFEEVYGWLPDIWVHPQTGDVEFLDEPDGPGYKRKLVIMLTGFNRNLEHIPDTVAIKEWIEEDVLRSFVYT